MDILILKLIKHNDFNIKKEIIEILNISLNLNHYNFINIQIPSKIYNIIKNEITNPCISYVKELTVKI
jgi:hypothetical protein